MEVIRFTLLVSACVGLNAAMTTHLNFTDVQRILDCNFDTNICSWTQSKNDDFDWSMHSQATPTDDTGPTADHGGSGQYLFIETSAPRTLDEVATLTSPEIDTWNHLTMCFHVFYFAYGADLGDLKVTMSYTKFKSGTVDEFSLAGHGSEQAWKQASFTIVPDAPFQIHISGIVGNGYLGDIAIDDISVTEGPCQTP